MTVFHIADRGELARPRYICAITDGSRDDVFTAASPEQIKKKVRRTLVSRGDSGLRLYCRNGQIAGEIFPHGATVTRMTREVSQMARADWLLVRAVEDIGTKPVPPSAADRDLANLDTSGGPVCTDDGDDETERAADPRASPELDAELEPDALAPPAGG